MNGLELIHCENPRLLPLGDYINQAEWPERLSVDPLVGFDRVSSSERDRRLLLKQMSTMFEPTKNAIAVVSTMQDMVWNSCIMNNPLLPANRYRATYAYEQQGKKIQDLHWLPTFADVLVIQACTGLGKSAAVKRYLSLIEQVWRHDACKSGDWFRHAQITHLIVPMAVHRGGFLYAILVEMDRVLGSKIAPQYSDPRRWPAEKLAVEVAILLVQHAVGVLVIEEIQARNFGESQNRQEMLLFILRLLNFGVAVVLVGNPLGFVGIEDFTQDINRLTENEPVHLMPFERVSTEWAEGLGPGMWAHNVMPIATPWSEHISRLLYGCTASFPGFTRKAVCAVQTKAMQRGSKSVELTDLESYANESETMRVNRDLIEGFVNKDPLRLMRYLDVPWEQYGAAWGKLSLDDIADSPVPTSVSDEKVPDDERAALASIHDRMRRNAQRALSRAGGKGRSTSPRNRTPKSGDLAGLELAAALQNGLENLKAQVEAPVSGSKTGLTSDV